MLLVAFLSAIGFLIISIKALGVKQLIEYEIPIDIFFTIGFLFLSGGTFSGITMAVSAGVIFSLMLATLRILCRK